MQNNPTYLMVVAAALVRLDGRILLQKRREGRSMAGLWEFPGGKVEADETPEAALVRELAEELDVAVEERDLAPACFASADVGGRRMILLLYLCRQWEREPRAVESPQLGWFNPGEMRGLAMPPADLPLIDLLQQMVD